MHVCAGLPRIVIIYLGAESMLIEIAALKSMQLLSPDCYLYSC